MTRYAKDTTVSSDKSRAEIEATLRRYGATSFMYATTANRAVVAFEAGGRRVKFELPLPDQLEARFVVTPGTRKTRTAAQALALWEKACRQRWRALALCIKAKLEAVESGITTFEAEFLAHIVLPNGQTVHEHVAKPLSIAYEGGSMPPLLSKF